MAGKAIIDPGFTWDDEYGYSQCVRVGDLLYLAGQMPVDRDGAVVGEGDIKAQTRQVFANIEAVLAAAGSSLGDIVEATYYLTNMTDDFLGMWEVMGQHLTKDFPTGTALGVAALALPGQRVEIKVTALAR